VKVIDKGFDTDACRLFEQAEEAFALATNDCKMDGKNILEQYKGQMVVENEFHILKEPALVKAVFLKKPERVLALMFIVSVSLLLRALIQYRLRRGLKELTSERPRIGRNGGKLQDNPTYNFLND
jgi:transposase